MRRRSDLRRYQVYAADRVTDAPEVFLGMDMGLGKTAAVLTAFSDMLDVGEVEKGLVVAPLRVAENTWPDEIGEWAHLQGLRFSVLTGSTSERALAAVSDAPLHIINRENVRWLVEFWGKAWPYDMLIYDEASRLKAGSKRTGGGLEGVTKCWALGPGWGSMNEKKLRVVDEFLCNLLFDPAEGLTTQEAAERADVGPHFVKQLVTDNVLVEHKRIRPPSPPQMSEFGALCKIRSKLKRVVELSGTPAPNGEEDLWGPMYVLDRGKRLGATKKAFYKRWFIRHPSGYGYLPKQGAGEDIMHLLSDCMVVLKKEDYLEVPQTIHNVIHVDLTPKHREQYKNFKLKLYAEEYDVEAVNKGVLISKLLQFCIAEGTDVLTDRGWVAIEHVSESDRVWDGEEWVPCGGAVFQGQKATVDCFGVAMTPEHEVLTCAGWRTAKEVVNGESTEGLDRSEVRLPRGFETGRSLENEPCDLVVPMRLRERSRTGESISAEQTSTKRQILRVQARASCVEGTQRAHDDGHKTMGDLAVVAAPVPRPGGQRLSKLRRTWHRRVRRMVRIIQRFLARCSSGLRPKAVDRSNRQQPGVFQRQHSMDDGQSSKQEYADKQARRNSVGRDVCRGSSRTCQPEIHHRLQEISTRRNGGGISPTSNVYDVLDCGPRKRFVVRGTSGPLIVHNCNGSMYRPNEDGKEVVFVHDEKLKALESIIEEAGANQVLVAYSFRFDLERIKKKYSKAVIFEDEPNFVRLWNDKKIGIGLAHPASIGHGLNLQKGGHIAVWYGLPWSLELYQQFNQRLPRSGQENTVILHHILARQTEDESVYRALNSKGATQDRLMEMVRVRPGEVG